MKLTKRLAGKRIAALAADGFEYIELSIPKAALVGSGAEVDVISLHGGKIRGMNLTEPTRSVAVDRVLGEANAADYDALLLPGGFISPDFLRQSHLAREFVRAFDIANKPIATLCHGPWVLVSAELVHGRSLAAWPGIRDDIVHAGGVWRDQPLVRDRNWVTSRGPHDLKPFVSAMLDLFEHGPSAHGSDTLPGALSSSPQADAPPPLAVGAARVLPGPGLSVMAGLAAGTALGALAFRSNAR